MYNNNSLKHKRPQIKPLQFFLPTNHFDTINHTLERGFVKNKNLTAENQHPQNAITINPRKSIERNVFGYHEQPINITQRTYLQKKITSHDFNKKKAKHNSIRYEQIDESKKKSPYVRELDRRNYLNKSNKIKSGSISKNASPTSFNQYPKSSLSNPYEMHKQRRYISVSKNQIKQQNGQHAFLMHLEQGKRYYKQSKLDLAIQTFKKLLAIKKIPQAQYLLAVSYMNSNQYQKGINTFYQIITEVPDYKRNVYLLTAIAYKKLNKISSAIQILSKGITLFPQYYDCILYRAKLQLKEAMWQKAISDFNLAIQISSTKSFPYIGKSDALKQLGKRKQAIEILNQAPHSDLYNTILLRRGILYMQQNRLKEAIQDFESCIEIDSNNAQVFYYKGIAHKKSSNITQAMLSFQEAVKKDNNEYFVTRGVQEMIKIRIEEKDFYEAYHIIARSENLQINKSYIQDWRLYIEAALLLMKKKYKEGIQAFNILADSYGKKYKENINTSKEKYQFLKPLIYLYRAYGHFSLGNLKEAKLDYEAYDQFFIESNRRQSDPSKKYNCLLLKAIQGFPRDSKKYLEEAIQLYPNKSEPYFYLALVTTQQYIALQDGDLIDKVKQNLDKAIQYLPQLSNNHISSIYYHRAVIHLYTNQFDKSVTDIDKAIEKSQDNISKYFYLRGLIFACCGNFTQAIQDLTVAINLDEQFAKSYLQRAKCLQMEGNPNQAFLDLQKYITLKPEDPFIHKYAGFLLFQNCAYEDCLSAFSHGSNFITDIDLIITKAKCHLLLGKYSEALDCLQNYHKQSGELDYILDSIIVNLIKNIQTSTKSEKFDSAIQVLTKVIQSKKNQGKLFKLMDIYLIRGGVFACDGNFTSAIHDFQEALKMKQKERKSELEKRFLADESEQDEEQDFGWSILQASYCISICYLAMQEPKKALQVFSKTWVRQQFSQNINWLTYKEFIQFLVNNDKEKNEENIIEYVNRIGRIYQDQIFSKFLPEIQISLPLSSDTIKNIKLPLIFNYPDIEPPELLPEFDHQLLINFNVSKVENKPQAPWINRNSNGVIFTSNVQVFENLELSISDANKKNQASVDGQTVPIQDSMRQLSFERQQIKIQKKDIKNHLKLDAQIEKKLQRLMGKNTK